MQSQQAISYVESNPSVDKTNTLYQCAFFLTGNRLHSKSRPSEDALSNVNGKTEQHINGAGPEIVLL